MTMHAYVYHGPAHASWESVVMPTLRDDTDAIVRIEATTICGSEAPQSW